MNKTKNADPVAPTDSGLKSSGQNTAETGKPESGNSGTSPAGTGEAPEANVSSQTHDAGKTVNREKESRKTDRWGVVEIVKVSDIELHPLSKKIYGDGISPTLLASIQDEGIQTPAIVSRKSGHVLSGNSRLAAAIAAGLEVLPVIYREGDLSPEEEEDIVITSNAGREKNRVMKVREYMELKRIEVALAKVRKSEKLQKRGKGPNLEPSTKSRHKAAERVGESASTLDKGVKVIEAAEKLEADGNADEAQALLTMLNTESFDAAFKNAQEKEVIPATKKKAGKALATGVNNEHDEDEEPTDGSLKPGDLDDEPDEGVENAGQPARKKDKEAPVPELDLPPLSEADNEARLKATEDLDAVETFLKSKVVPRMSKAQKDELGEQIGKVNRLAAEAGITVSVK
ncbi:MAG: ParB N-terminal domain-containing protein [Terrimicrobiaceae bacterium]